MTQELFKEIKIIQGNEAAADAAIAAGCRFFSGYPITPATEIAEQMSKRLPQVNGVFIQMEDELASICAAIGASLGGMMSCTASSGPGISLMQEGIGFAACCEVPVVIINVMRVGPSTGMATSPSQQDIMQAKFGSHGDYEIIALMPSSCQEMFELTYKAFSFSQKYRVPVYVLSDEIVSHTREKVRIPKNLKPIVIKKPSKKKNYKQYKAGPNGLLDGMPSFNEGHKLLIVSDLHDDDGTRTHDPAIGSKLTERLCKKITNNASQLLDFEAHFLEDAEIVVVSFGSPARPALRAVKDAREKNIKAGFMKIRTIWPFPEEAIFSLSKTAHTIIVPELNIGRIAHVIKGAAAGQTEIVSLPKLGGLLHTPGEILTEIEKRTSL